MPISLLQQLDAIEPSEVEPGFRLYPCSAQLNDGTVLECIYFMTAATSKRLLGREGSTLPDRYWVSKGDVASIRKSPVRLPASLANQIYRAGETHNGCYIFTLVFSRWVRRGYLVGGFVDFLDFPTGHGPSDVKELLLRIGPSRASQVPEYRWCVYSG
jgi:hypothetical protein